MIYIFYYLHNNLNISYIIVHITRRNDTLTPAVPCSLALVKLNMPELLLLKPPPRTNQISIYVLKFFLLQNIIIKKKFLVFVYLLTRKNYFFFLFTMKWKKLSMIYIFYYINNNLNIPHIIVIITRRNDTLPLELPKAQL